jgi:hypothetical protein
MERTIVPRQVSPIDDLIRKHYQLLGVIYQKHSQELTMHESSIAAYWRRQQQTGENHHG